MLRPRKTVRRTARRTRCLTCVHRRYREIWDHVACRNWKAGIGWRGAKLQQRLHARMRDGTPDGNPALASFVWQAPYGVCRTLSASSCCVSLGKTSNSIRRSIALVWDMNTTYLRPTPNAVRYNACHLQLLHRWNSSYSSWERRTCIFRSGYERLT